MMYRHLLQFSPSVTLSTEKNLYLFRLRNDQYDACYSLSNQSVNRLEDSYVKEN